MSGGWEVESVIITGANTGGIWLRRAAIRLSHRILHNLLCLMTYQMTIWMCRRHDDFRSAAPIVEIAVQLHVTSASKKVGGGLSPSPKSGGPIPLSSPCSDAYDTASGSVVPGPPGVWRAADVVTKTKPSLKQRDSLPLNAAIGELVIGSPPVWSRDNLEGV